MGEVQVICFWNILGCVFTSRIVQTYFLLFAHRIPPKRFVWRKFSYRWPWILSLLSVPLLNFDEQLRTVFCYAGTSPLLVERNVMIPLGAWVRSGDCKLVWVKCTVKRAKRGWWCKCLRGSCVDAYVVDVKTCVPELQRVSEAASWLGHRGLEKNGASVCIGINGS